MGVTQIAATQPDHEPLGELPEPLLTAQDVARILQISEPQAYKLLRTAIPHQRIGRNVRVTRTFFNAWLASTTVGADAVGVEVRDA